MISQEFDEAQKIFPIWGTCLGFEVLLMLTRRSINILDTCKGYDFATELTFMPGIHFFSNRMYFFIDY